MSTKDKRLLHDTDTLLMQKAITAHEHIYMYKYNRIQDSKLYNTK